MMRPICLVALLPALFFGACLLDPKTGCLTTDDCAPGRVCVAGMCQRAGHDAGLDAGSDSQPSGDVAIDLPEALSSDLAGGPDRATDWTSHVVDAAPDAPATIDVPVIPAGLDASPENRSSGDVAIDQSENLSPDLAGDLRAAVDLASLLVDAAPDAPMVVMTDAVLDGPAPATIDALDSSTGLDASFDKRPSGDGAADLQKPLSPDVASDPERAPDSTVLPIDAAPDVPIAPAIDVPDSSQSGIDAGSADCDEVGGPTNTWELIGGTPISGPGVTQWGPGQNIGVFWRGTDDRLKHKWFPDNDAWSPEQDLGGTLASEPVAVSRTTNMVDVFWRGTDNHLKHKWYPYGDGWSWEQDLGGTLASSPAAASWGTVALHVFWQGPDGNLKHKWLDYATNLWTDEIDLGIPVQSDPAAQYENNGIINVFWRGSSGTLQHIWSYDGTYWSTNWTSVQDLGGAIAADSSPSATGRRDGWIDVFWKGTDNHLKHIWMNRSSEWSPIEKDLGGDLASSPGAISWGGRRMDVFAKDTPTGQMAHRVWNEDSVVTLNDTDPGITYSSGWTYVSQPPLWDYGGDAHYATTDGSYVEYTFSGTGVDYVTERSSDQGDVDVYIDGAFQQTASCYNSTRLVQQVAYGKKGLASGSHTIRISKRNGSYMLLDALRTYP